MESGLRYDTGVNWKLISCLESRNMLTFSLEDIMVVEVVFRDERILMSPLSRCPFNLMQPYLHESRHLHALNRVRGSGGRFLSTKKLQEPDSISNAGSGHLQQKGDAPEYGVHQSVASTACSSDINSVSNINALFRQPEQRFSSMPPHMGGAMQGGGGGGGSSGGYGQWSPAPGCTVRSR